MQAQSQQLFGACAEPNNRAQTNEIDCRAYLREAELRYAWLYG